MAELNYDEECGLTIVKEEQNRPYVLVQMGCEFVKKWKALVPTRLQMISVVGYLTYWVLRIFYLWITRVPGLFGVVTNRFFVVCPESQEPHCEQTGSTGNHQTVNNLSEEDQ